MESDVASVATRLEASVAAIAARPDHDAYAVEMWEYALAYHRGEEDPESVPPAASEACDAIPYIPPPAISPGDEPDETTAILDVGCLGGYGLYDIALRRRRANRDLPVLRGIDASGESVAMARELGETWGLGADLAFERVSIENLDHAPGSYDLVIARLLLPYVEMETALAKMARILKPGGKLLVQLHAPAYYRRQFVRNLARPVTAFYYLRPIMAGMLYGTTGRQSKRPWFSETALSVDTATRHAKRHGFHEIWRGGFDVKPLALLCKGSD